MLFEKNWLIVNYFGRDLFNIIYIMNFNMNEFYNRRVDFVYTLIVVV